MDHEQKGKLYHRGWEVIVKDQESWDPLNQTLSIGVKKYIDGELVGSFAKVSRQFLATVKEPFIDFVFRVASRLIDEAVVVFEGAAIKEVKLEGEIMGTTGTSPSYTTSARTAINYGSGTGWWQYPPSDIKGVLGSFKGVDFHITTNKESEMGQNQETHVYQMIAVELETHEVLAEGFVFARSPNAANIKFTVAKKLEADAIGDTIALFILWTGNLPTPFAELGVTKVKVVE